MLIKNMKWPQRRIRLNSSVTTSNKGSITFEAALVMPLFVAFLFVFYAAIIAISSQMTLQHLATQSAQKISNYIHPVALTSEYVSSTLELNKQASFEDASEGVTKLVYDIGTQLPHPLNVLIQEGAKGNYWPAVNVANTILGGELLKGLFIGETSLNKDNIHITYLQLPDVINHTDQNVIVALRYDLPFEIPFIGYRFSVSEQAMQRVWLPDVRNANYEIDDHAERFIYVVSIEPNPLKRGRKATIKVQTVENSNISLEVIYKSGKSIARNLGTKVSNGQGAVEWTWHVSGNTTPGIWMLKLTLTDTGESIEYPFQVIQ